MNPVPVMKLVEIIRGLETSEATYQTVKELSEALDKQDVEVKDFPGFVSNRILMPMINEAVYTVFEGIASIEDVHQVMKLGMNHPMGRCSWQISLVWIHAYPLWRFFTKASETVNIVHARS